MTLLPDIHQRHTLVCEHQETLPGMSQQHVTYLIWKQTKCPPRRVDKYITEYYYTGIWCSREMTHLSHIPSILSKRNKTWKNCSGESVYLKFEHRAKLTRSSLTYAQRWLTYEKKQDMIITGIKTSSDFWGLPQCQQCPVHGCPLYDDCFTSTDEFTMRNHTTLLTWQH